MSDLNSDSIVVRNVYGEPSATDQPSARSVARPSMSCSTAKLALIPAPFTSFPCTYSRRTLGPMPLGHTAMTLMLEGNFAPTFFMWPRR